LKFEENYKNNKFITKIWNCYPLLIEERKMRVQNGHTVTRRRSRSFSTQIYPTTHKYKRRGHWRMGGGRCAFLFSFFTILHNHQYGCRYYTHVYIKYIEYSNIYYIYLYNTPLDMEIVPMMLPLKKSKQNIAKLLPGIYTI